MVIFGWLLEYQLIRLEKLHFLPQIWVESTCACFVQVDLGLWHYPTLSDSVVIQRGHVVVELDGQIPIEDEEIRS